MSNKFFKLVSKTLQKAKQYLINNSISAKKKPNLSDKYLKFVFNVLQKTRKYQYINKKSIKIRSNCFFNFM